jgi:hypothetical protein
MDNVEAVRRLATVRGDDLLDGGVVSVDPERLMMVTHEIANDYAGQYRTWIEAQPAPGGAAGAAGAAVAAGAAAPETNEDELRWVFLGERERIGELAKLTGQLRYAVDGGDERLTRATVEQIERLRRHLPDKFRIGEFIVAARRPGEIGRRLAELYIDRCYKLSGEEYETLADLDRQIADLERPNA